MIDLQAKDIEELEKALTPLVMSGDFLFRGQTREYFQEGSPNIQSSFSRLGCVPPVMLRWSHYSNKILAEKLGIDESAITMEHSHAILQHYGWRSFYIDASNSPAVAAWFASHLYTSKPQIELCEDCFEEPVFLTKTFASYQFEDGDGVIYALSKERLRKEEIGLFDLQEMAPLATGCRFVSQKAVLIGPTKHRLSNRVMAVRIRAPRSVFQKYAEQYDLERTEHLFPTATADPVYAAFLQLPWIVHPKFDVDSERIIPFERSVQIPEYHASFRKILSPSIALYSHASAGSGAEVPDFTFIPTPEVALTGVAEAIEYPFNTILKKLEANGKPIVFEFDTLAPSDEIGDGCQYMKGIFLQLKENSTIEVCEFYVDHPGCTLAGAGYLEGWHYKVSADGLWKRHISENDCKCGNELRHERLFRSLGIIESLAAEGQIENWEFNSPPS